jgi:hypothetical protein
LLKKASGALIVGEDGLNFCSQLFVIGTGGEKCRSMLKRKVQRLME